MISPPPYRDTDLSSLAWQKWFSSVFDSFKNIDTNGDVIVNDSSRGIVLKDTNGNYWRITIQTDGTTNSVNLGTTKPQGI